MRIAIPVSSKEGLSSSVAQHFGRCPSYAILNEEGELTEFLDNTSEHNGGQGLPPELLRDNNVQVLICHGIGPKALHLCRDFDIVVYVGNRGTADEIFKQWKERQINPAGDSDVCGSHR